MMNSADCAISVVIPTLGRVDILKKCLLALTRQGLKGISYEAIVIDDGPGDEAGRMIAGITESGGCDIRCLKGERKGVGAARNIGIQAANSDIILIIGNDIIAGEGFLAEHLRFHEKFPGAWYAVLGQTRLSENSKISPFMESWGDLPYRELGDDLDAPWWFFWTGNISLKRGFLMEQGMFDEDFRSIGFEDVEIGFRLSRYGLKIKYNREAVAYHDHPYTIEDACRQQISHGYSFGLLAEKLTAQGFIKEVAYLAERFGINGIYNTWRGFIKSAVKSSILHRNVVMEPIRRWLVNEEVPGTLARFMYPKLFSYYTNLGYLKFLREKKA